MTEISGELSKPLGHLFMEHIRDEVNKDTKFTLQQVREIYSSLIDSYASRFRKLENDMNNVAAQFNALASELRNI